MIYKTRPTQRQPEMIYCPKCNLQVTSRIQFDIGNGGFILMGGMCLFGLIPCCLIPLCSQDCQDCKHFCAICGQYLGKKQFLFDENY